jgi:hypothetical protein
MVSDESWKFLSVQPYEVVEKLQRELALISDWLRIGPAKAAASTQSDDGRPKIQPHSTQLGYSIRSSAIKMPPQTCHAFANAIRTGILRPQVRQSARSRAILVAMRPVPTARAFSFSFNRQL